MLLLRRIGKKSLKISNAGIEHRASPAGAREPEQEFPVMIEAIRRLRDSGVDSPAANAQAILSYLLNRPVVELYINEINLCADDLLSLEQMLSRRIKGEPLQYITGTVNFLGYDIGVEKGVFIPRPETEILVETMISLLSGLRRADLNILDLCAGSGNIAISLTKALTHCKIIGSDISDLAVKTAGENAARNSASEGIVFIKADLFSLADEYRKSFDAIICNPPYISCGEMNSLSIELKHEPVEALCGGADGMDFYRRIAKDAPDFLKEGGIIGLEIPDNSVDAVRAIINSSGKFSDIMFFNDLNDIARVVTARLK